MIRNNLHMFAEACGTPFCGRSDCFGCQSTVRLLLPCNANRRRNKMTYSCGRKKSIPEYFLFLNSLRAVKGIKTGGWIHDHCGTI
jgi:hypothetical protein